MDASTSHVFFYFISFFVLVIRNFTFLKILSYAFPINVGSKRAIPFPAFSLVGRLCFCDVYSTIYVPFMVQSVSFTSASSYLEYFMSSIISDIWSSISSELFMTSSTLSLLSEIFPYYSSSPTVSRSLMQFSSSSSCFYCCSI